MIIRSPQRLVGWACLIVSWAVAMAIGAQMFGPEASWATALKDNSIFAIVGVALALMGVSLIVDAD